MKNICIIGGGASGMMAGISAASNGGRVTIYEANQDFGKKLLRTGNGKCNLGNLNLTPTDYLSSYGFLKDAFDKFGTEDLIKLFNRLGLLIKSRDGWLYPYCEQAHSVRDCMVSELESLNVTMKTNAFINALSISGDGGFLVSVEGQKERVHYDRVIVAAGSKAGHLKKERANGYDLLNALGIKITPLYPGLTRLVCECADLNMLDGVRQEATASLYIDDVLISSEHGELLFKNDGISGILVFILSNYCNPSLSEGKRVTVKLDLLSDFSQEDLTEYIRVRCLLNGDKSVEAFFKGMFCDKLNDFVIKESGLVKNKRISDYEPERIISAVTAFKSLSLKVTGTGDFENAQITVGGVKTEALTEYMEVKDIPGLYVTGELVDISGPCGGYNLEWAFASGYIAGEHACL